MPRQLIQKTKNVFSVYVRKARKKRKNKKTCFPSAFGRPRKRTKKRVFRLLHKGVKGRKGMSSHHSSRGCQEEEGGVATPCGLSDLAMTTPTHTHTHTHTYLLFLTPRNECCDCNTPLILLTPFGWVLWRNPPSHPFLHIPSINALGTWLIINWLMNMYIWYVVYTRNYNV